MELKKHQPITITPHLFQLGTKSFPAYLSLGKEGMIIEGGTGPTSDIIVSQIDSLGIDPDRIKYIALTHTHADHIGAVPRLRKLWPHIKVLAGPVAAKFLKRETFVKEFLPMDKMIGRICLRKKDITTMPPILDEYRFEADRVIEENDRIDLGGIVWKVFLTPGHSPCHISLFEENEKTLAIGDTTGYFDPEFDVFWPNYFHSMEIYCESILKMMTISAKRLLLSHNGVIEGNVKLHFEKALKATKNYHEEILNKLDHGKGREDLCKEHAEWVCSLGALASYEAIFSLCRLLLKRSQDARGAQFLELPRAEAA
ncbi:MAG: MBL fold metallo-hydrolase [Deltaproteobacteria bacterium]|nr:MBL fold metallo-hydrolase [Deltaproteobacteria bacterium]